MPYSIDRYRHLDFDEVENFHKTPKRQTSSPHTKIKIITKPRFRASLSKFSYSKNRRRLIFKGKKANAEYQVTKVFGDVLAWVQCPYEVYLMRCEADRRIAAPSDGRLQAIRRLSRRELLAI